MTARHRAIAGGASVCLGFMAFALLEAARQGEHLAMCLIAAGLVLATYKLLSEPT